MNKIPWILFGIGVLLVILSDGESPVIAWIAIIFLLLGAIPLCFQYLDKRKRDNILGINKGLYRLGYTDNEVNERQPKLQSATIFELKSINSEVESQLKEQEKREFFKPSKK